MQAAGGVDDDDVAAVAPRPLDRVVGDGRRVSPALALDELGVGTLCPDPELLLRGGTEGIRRGDDDGVAVLAQTERELADRRRLAGAVDADDEDHRRLAGEVDARRLSEERRHLLRQGLVQVADVAARLEAPDELGRRRDADVAGDQRLLEPLPRRRVARVECGGRELLRERAAAAAERVAQAREQTRALLAALPVGTVVAEQLSPGACHGGEP